MKTVNVVAGIIIEGNKILATQRGYGEFKDGWEFPGGKMELGETPQQALVRELKEELDVIVSVDDFLCTVEYNYSTFHLSMDCYFCSITSGTLSLLEHKAAKWLDKSNLHSVNWLPADISVIKAIIKN